MLTLEEIFPPYGLRIACGPVELRVLRDDDLPELVELVHDGIHAPDQPMPFLTPWHQEPYAPGDPDGFPTSSLVHWWTQRATFAPDAWRLALTVRRDGAVVGMQGLFADHLAQTREVRTGSWLGRAHQGRGTGTLMRQLVVGLAFDELGAQRCESATWQATTRPPRSAGGWGTSRTVAGGSCNAPSTARSARTSSAWW